jgi:molybdopterin-synthase adenylyltransferase
VLEKESDESIAILCGRQAVQVSPARSTHLNLNLLAERFTKFSDVQVNPYLLKFNVGEYELTVFKDARLIVRGTDDASVARSLYAKYIGI